MLPGGVTEVVWHFAGYLQIFEDIARDRADIYDGSSSAKQTDDPVSTSKLPGGNPDFDFVDIQALSPVQPSSQLDDLHTRIHDLKKVLPPHFDAPKPVFDGEESSFHFWRIPVRGGGFDDYTQITVTQENGGEQSLAQFHQINAMQDDDVLLPGSPSTLLTDHIALWNAGAGDVVVEMAANANDQIPQQWWMSQDDAGAQAFVTDHDQNLVLRDGAPDAHEVAPGYYLNGVLQDPAPPPPDQVNVPDFPLPAPDLGHALGQWAEAGGNTSLNAALVVDMTESARTMIVMGDYFKTDAIFQTNSTMDNDHVTAIGGSSSSISSGGDQATNIADFAQLPGIYADITATFAGPNWHIDVVNGNYYDVQTLTQTNFMFDNDVVVQNSSDTHFAAISGTNGQGNETELFNGNIQYDLIIVAGGYHGMNVIFQNNVLLNNDYIKMMSDGADPTQSIESGNNTLSNTATIEHYGGDNIQTMDADLEKVVTAVKDGPGTLDPSYGDLVDGSGGGTFNVLYVTGDYYDVNAVWQTNVTSDVNVIMQLLNPASSGAAAIAAMLDPGSAETQSVVTGNNSLTNNAVIVDVAPTNTYVNGQVYGDTILVQANLLPTTDKDHALSGDTQSLVPELVAFLNDSQEQTTTTASPAAVATVPHDDPMANVMH